jgi:protein dithiol:quinone oxidoreductase
MNTRSFYFGIAIFCFALLGGAYYLQHVEKQFPCPFCILQRYTYLAIGLVSLVAAGHGPRVAGWGRRIYAALIALFGAAGVTLALWLLLKASNDKACGADAIAEFVNGLPPAGWYSDYFFANGGCTDVWPPILGVSLAMWSLLCFSALTIAGIMSIKSALQK